MPEITDMLARYLATRDAERDDRVNRVFGALSDRERTLVREAAVMGYVLGAQGGRLETAFPKDSAIVWGVIDACQARADLYPSLGGSADGDEEAP